MKYGLKRMCGKDMVQYARPTIVAIIFLKLFQIVASNNDTKGNNINSILLTDSSTHNLTQTSKIGLEENNLQFQNTSHGDNKNRTSNCEVVMEDVETLSFWFEGVVEMIISVVGLVANSVAVPLLTSSKRLSSSFNRLLACLAVIDNVFILTCLAEALRRYVFPITNIHQLLFTYVFYPLQSISLMCSNNATVVLALERYLAVTRPVEYHINVTASGASPWRRVMRYMIPTVLFSVLFNLPKFFEVTCVYHISLGNDTLGNNYTVTPVNITSDICYPQLTPLRSSPIYALWYVHVARLFVSGIIPFSLLVFLNVEVYRAVNSRAMDASSRRKTMAHSTKNGQNANEKQKNTSAKGTTSNYAEEQKMAIVLFFIVALYLASNTPRLILNFYEFFINEAFQESSKASSNTQSNCLVLPKWVMVTTSVSLVLITSNASTNFFIYCFVNNAFREELSRHWKVLTRRLGIDKAYNFAQSWHKSKPEVVVLETDNIANSQNIEMDDRSRTIATDILNRSKTSDNCLETIVEASNTTDNARPEIEIEEHKASEEINGHKNKHTQIGNNAEAIQVDERQPLNVTAIHFNRHSDRLASSKKSLTIQPETVVKIYCDYDAVRV